MIQTLNVTQKQFFDSIDFVDHLKNYCSGGGLTLESIEEKKRTINITYSYHEMNENGCYDGYTFFTVKLPIIDYWVVIDHFDMVCNGKYRKYWDIGDDFYYQRVSYDLEEYFKRYNFNYRTEEIFDGANI